MPQLSASHVFLSYCRRDSEAMKNIVSFLRGQNIKVWVDNERLTPGTPIWEEEIEKAIKGAFAIVVLLSPDSKSSEWVRREVTLADQFRKRIFPVLVTGNEEDSIPLRLITRQFVDIRTNDVAGFHSLKTAISFYLEELHAQEEKERLEAERLALAEEQRKVAEREAERLKQEQEAAERAAQAALEKAAKEKAEREAAEREAERLKQEQEAAERATQSALEKAAKEKAEREAAEREATRLEAERKAEEQAKHAALEEVNKEKIVREAAEKEAEQLKAERSAAQKNIFSRMAYVWSGWSRGKRIFASSLIMILGTSLFAGVSMLATLNKDPLPYAPVQLVLAEDTPIPIPITMQNNIAYDLTFSPDGRFLAGYSEYGFKIWNLEDSSVVRTIADFSHSIAYSPDGKMLATGGISDINLYNIEDSTIPPVTLNGHTSNVWDLAFSPDGKTIASGSEDKTVRIWDVGTGNLRQTLNGHNDKVNSIAISPDGEKVVSGSEDKTVRIWKLSNGQVLETIEEKTPINDVAYSPSGKYLALASDEGIKVLDTITLQVVAQVSLSYPYCLAFSPDSNTLAVGLLDNNVILINANSGEIVDKFSGHTDAVHSIEFSPDGTLLASGAFDSTIRLWKINP